MKRAHVFRIIGPVMARSDKGARHEDGAGGPACWLWLPISDDAVKPHSPRAAEQVIDHLHDTPRPVVRKTVVDRLALPTPGDQPLPPQLRQLL